MARYKAIKDHLRAAIERGDWEEGAVLPSENQLAAQFSVSRSLARQALRELAIEGFVIRSQGRATRVAVRKPGESPPAPQTGMQVIALVATGLQTRFTRSVMEHFMHRSAQLGHQTLQYRTWFEPESELAFAQDLLKRGLVGAALQLNFQNEAAHEILAYLHGAGLPFVQVDRAMPGLSANVVTSDNVGIGKTLTSRLLQDGHERIAAVVESYNPSTVADRLLGYRQALEARGLPLDETLTLPCVVDDPGDFQLRLESVLGSERAPTAFFCVNEFTARLVAQTLDALGRDRLTEFAFGMVDDNSFDEPLRVQGHRAVQDAAALGSRAAELLARAINDPATPPRYVRVPAARYVRVPSGDEESVAASES